MIADAIQNGNRPSGHVPGTDDGDRGIGVGTRGTGRVRMASGTSSRRITRCKWRLAHIAEYQSEPSWIACWSCLSGVGPWSCIGPSEHIAQSGYDGVVGKGHRTQSRSVAPDELRRRFARGHSVGEVNG